MGDNDILIEKKLTELLDSLESTVLKSERDLIIKACNIGSKYYDGEITSDGKPFILYNLDIALIAVREIGLGPTSAICSLLHGIERKTSYSIKNIRNDFGEQVAEIIIGFNKLSQYKTERISFNSEQFRTMFLSLVDDMRVILIRLAHRLNDIRHIDIIEDKREQVIDEVKFLYTPIAHRLGLYKIKAELEERVMLFEQPDIFREITNRIKETKAKREVYIKDFIRPIERELMANRFSYEIKWRTKSVPSIWAKMNRQNVPFEEVYDLFAIRIVLDSRKKKEKEDCWRVYSLVTNIYPPNPKRLRDWITTPKASGYESLHTTVQGINDRWIEVQIRTARMDEEAEKGQAAHWQYKGVMKKKDTENWLSQVRDILENPDQIFHDSSYKSNGSKQNESVFVFTPMGDLRQFPKGATVLDFAFGIHTDLGSKCSGAIINNKVVPIRYALQNGDKVEIISNKNQIPKDDWLSVVTTDKAKTRIRKYLKEINYTEADIGKSLLLRKFKNWKVKSSDELIGYLLKCFKLEAAIDLYYKVAIDQIDLTEVRSLVNKYQEEALAGKKVTPDQPKPEHVKQKLSHRENDNEILYIGDNLSSVDYRMAKCCNPIHGDKVFGFITTMGGVTIHRVNCPNARRLKEKYHYRVLDVSWIESEKQSLSTVIIRITGVDRLGLVGEITKVISDDLRVNMRSISFETSGKKFMGKVSVTIRNYDHLEQLIAKLLKVKGVDKVVRAK